MLGSAAKRETPSDSCCQLAGAVFCFLARLNCPVHVCEGDFDVANVKDEPGDDDGEILTVDDG